MKVDVLNMEGKKVRDIELPASIFEAPIKKDLMHQAYVRQMANARLGTHETQTRADVAGGGKKPWRQKGTGRARQGSSRAPHWKGGGNAHSPHPHSYELAMPRQMRRAALRSALSARAADNGILVLDSMVLPEPKTRLMAQALNTLVGDSSALILVPEKAGDFEGVVRATNNLPDAKILHASYINIRDLLSFGKIILPVATLDVLTANLG